MENCRTRSEGRFGATGHVVDARPQSQGQRGELRRVARRLAVEPEPLAGPAGHQMNMDVEYRLAAVATVELQQLDAHWLKLRNEYGHEHFGAAEQRRDGVLFKLEQVSRAASLRDDEHMVLELGKCVQEGENAFVDAMTSYLPAKNPRERIVRIIMPEGAHYPSSR